MLNIKPIYFNIYAMKKVETIPEYDKDVNPK